MSRIAYNQREVDLLARLIRAEAVGEGDEGMLLVGNVVVNRVAAQCDVFRDVTSITEAVYQEKELAQKTIEYYRRSPETYALWFKNPGTNVICPEKFYGYLAGRFKSHCFYDPGEELRCDF